MNLKQRTAVPQVSQEGAPPAEKKSGPTGLLLLMIGALLLTLAAGDALAVPERGGGGSEALSGTDRNDLLTGFGGDEYIRGLGGDDEIYGGEGRDVTLGGTGDDFIEAKDGGVDFVGCGSGNDVASVDFRDRVARDCEKLYPG